jgi:hypothetical protein
MWYLIRLFYSHIYHVWAALGPLVGVGFGAWLAAHWQRRKWLLDNKTAEYRAIFDALGTYRFELTEYHALYKFATVAVSAQKKYEDQIRLAKAMEAVTNAFADRIFTRQAIVASGARDAWGSYAGRVKSGDPDIQECTKLLNAVHGKLIKASQDDLKLAN